MKYKKCNRINNIIWIRLCKENVLGENKTLVEQLDELRDQLNEISEISQTVNLTASDAYKTTLEGLMNIDEAEKVLDKIHAQLTVRKII